MSRQWFKIKILLSIRSSDLTVQSFLTKDSLLRISRINSTRIVVSLYTSWLHSLHARLTLSYHTIVSQPHSLYDMNWMMLNTKNERVIYISLVTRIVSVCLIFCYLFNVVQYRHVCLTCMFDWRTYLISTL